MKIKIGKTDKGWEVRANGLTDDAIITCRSHHETACEAAREAAGLLRVWATTEGECKPMKALWLVVGESEKSDGFAHVVSADSRLDAVDVLAKTMGLSWAFSRNDHDKLCVIINMRDTPVEDGWEAGCPRYFWEISCSPIEFGVNMISAEAREWGEEEVER